MESAGEGMTAPCANLEAFHRIARAANYGQAHERFIGEETRVLIALELIRMRRQGLISALYADNGRIQVRHKPESILVPLSWPGAAKLVMRAAREAKRGG